MPANKQVQDAKSLVEQRIKNEEKLQEKFKALGQINPVLPLSEEERQIKLYEDVREQDAVYGDELSTLMMPLINDKQFMNYLLQYLSPEQIKDLVLNWVKYLPELKKYEGQRVSKAKFVEILEDIMADNISKKQLRGEIQSHKQAQFFNSRTQNASSASNQNLYSQPDIIDESSDLPRSEYTEVPRSTRSTRSQYPELGYDPYMEIPSSLKYESRSEQPATLRKPPPPLLLEDVKHEEPPGLKNEPIMNPKDITDRQQVVINDYNQAFTRALVKVNATNDLLKFVLKQYCKVTKKDVNNLNKDKLLELLYTFIQAFHAQNKFDEIKFIIRDLGLVSRKNQNYNEFQILYLPYADWIQDRRNLAIKGEYQGFGLKPFHAKVGKYYVDQQKLGRGILEVRYAKNRHLTNIKPQMISNEMRKVVTDMVNKNSFDPTDYHKLQDTEKHLARGLNQMFGCGVDVHSDDSLDKELQICLGETEAGNNSHQLKQKARKLIMYAIKTGRFPRNVGMDLMYENGI